MSYKERAYYQVGDLYIKGRWLKAKFDTTCQCGNTIKPGDDLWFVPYKKRSYCYDCGAKDYPEELRELLSDKK